MTIEGTTNELHFKSFSVHRECSVGLQTVSHDQQTVAASSVGIEKSSLHTKRCRADQTINCELPQTQFLEPEMLAVVEKQPVALRAFDELMVMDALLWVSVEELQTLVAQAMLKQKRAKRV